MDKHLHIICLDIPFPTDYGGVFDLFYKIKALSEAGIKIHLHCFQYGRDRRPELNKYCTTVQYYTRRTGIGSFSLRLPYIVNSRKNDELLQNLLNDDHPILVEGIHCSYFVSDTRFRKRTIFLRLHNVEYVYYNELVNATRSMYRKLYYWWESRLLLRYEQAIARKVPIITVSEKDSEIYRRQFMADDVNFIPVFVPYSQVSVPAGVGNYCLYHGNLSVPENERSAIWLLDNVFNDLDTPFVIAGKNPSSRLKKAVSKRANTCIAENPADGEMQDLIVKAQLHVLPSFNMTGIKLKLLNALFNGRHCVVNNAAASGTIPPIVCHVGQTGADMKKIIRQLYYRPVSDNDVQSRRKLLEEMYDNRKNVQRLIQLIW